MMIATKEPNNKTIYRTGHPSCLVLTWLLLSFTEPSSYALDFAITQIADESLVHRDPTLSENGLAAWISYGRSQDAQAQSDLFVYHDGKTQALTKDSHDQFFGSTKPHAHSNAVVWVASYYKTDKDITWMLKDVNTPGTTTTTTSVSEATSANSPETVATNNTLTSIQLPPTSSPTNVTAKSPGGLDEICLWQIDATEIQRVTHDTRNDFAPSLYGNLIAWQVEKGWPYGWEIMISNTGAMQQLTTNYYYDMSPKVWNNQVVWYGWDGHDYEIYLYDHTQHTTTQITSNPYDDVSPIIGDQLIAWEGYPAAEADIFIWKNNKVEPISDNIEDDFNPKIGNGQVVWQGYDGTDFEIYYYDGEKPIKLTKNDYDDINPDIRDEYVCWMGHVANWDSEIFVWPGTGDPIQLTENELEDRDPQTASHRILWQTDSPDKSQIFLAEPK